MIGRVRDRATFDALRRHGQRARRGPVTVVYLPDAAPPPRAAYAIGRRVGNAVVRNRVRRRLRSILGEIERSSAGLPAGAYLLAAREGVADVAYDELRGHVAAACAAVSGAEGSA